MPLIISAVAMLAVFQMLGGGSSSAQSLASTSMLLPEAEASSAAEEGLGTLDAGQWDATWQRAGSLFRTQLTSQQWSPVIETVRPPLGRV